MSGVEVRHDWLAECRGLGYMLLDIAAQYRSARDLGGDSEILRDRIESAERYVMGPLASLVGRELLQSDG